MPTTQEYFLAALNHILDSGAMKQRDIAAKAGSASQTINAIVRGRKVAGLQKQEEIAEACGYEYVDFLLLGRSFLRGIPAGDQGRGKMSNQTAVVALTALVDQMLAAEKQLSVWRTAIFTVTGIEKKEE